MELNNNPVKGINLEYGRHCKDTGDYQQAADVFKAILPSSDVTTKAYIYRELAFVYEKLENPEEAITALEGALEIDKKDVDALEMLGRIYSKQKSFDKAVIYLQQALDLQIGFPKSQHSSERLFLIHAELANIYFNKTDHAKSLQETQSALKYNSNNFRMHCNIARLLFKLDCSDEAIQEVKSCLNSAELDMSSDGFQVYRELAILCFENGEFKITEECLIKMLEKADKNDTFLRNKILNRIEYVNKKVILESKPLRMMICLTRECNLNCIMCYDKYRKKWEIPDKTVEEIMQLFPFLEYVQWRGGEVFLYKNFKELFDKAASYPHLCQDIVTNGTLIDEAWAEKIIRTGTKLSLSIDGVHKDTYEKIRRGAKFEDVVNTLKLLKYYRTKNMATKFRPEIFMNFVVLRSNYKDVEDIVDFAFENGIEFVQTVAGDTADFPDNDQFKNEDVRNDKEVIQYLQGKLSQMHQKAKKFGIKYRNFFPEDACTETSDPVQVVSEKNEKKSVAKQKCYCRAPWDSLFVFLFDTVKPHCFCDVVIGDAKNEGLSMMWNNQVMQNYRKNVGAHKIDSFCSQRCKQHEPFENIGLNL